jgi:hypothetical protein
MYNCTCTVHVYCQVRQIRPLRQIKKGDDLGLKNRHLYAITDSVKYYKMLSPR